MLLHSQPVLFDIVLSSSNPLVFHGQDTEAQPQLVAGTVVLELAEPTSVKQIHFKFSGRSRLMWSDGTGTTARSHVEESEFFTRTWEFLHYNNHATYTLNAGRHEFPFSLHLPGDLPESIYCADGYVYYKLKAVVDRPTFASNFVIRKHLRVARAHDPTTHAFTHSVSVQNEWVDKLDYEISIPQKAYLLGDIIPLTIKLIPQVKNLQVNNIICSLTEYSTLFMGDHSSHAEKSRTRVIKAIKMLDFIRNDSQLVDVAKQASLDDTQSTRIRRSCSSTTIPDEVNLTQPIMAQGLNGSFTTFDPSEEQPALWTFTAKLTTPLNKYLCNPSFSSPHIPQLKIRHKLKISIFFLNSDGHLSELRAALPVIMLSERLGSSVQEDNSIAILPAYHDHIYDNLAMVASGTGEYLITPPLSRNNSCGQLVELTRLHTTPSTACSTPPVVSPMNTSSNAPPCPEELERQLLNAAAAQNEAMQQQTSSYSAVATDDELEDPRLVEAMSRVPSYTDATNATTSTFIPPYSESLPTYEAAVIS